MSATIIVGRGHARAAIKSLLDDGIVRSETQCPDAALSQQDA